MDRVIFKLSFSKIKQQSNYQIGELIMKSRWSITIILAAVLLALAFAGSSWEGAVAQTVPNDTQTLDGVGVICFGARCIGNPNDYVSLTAETPVEWNRAFFLRQPLAVTFNPEGSYVYFGFVLNANEREMMADGELCLGYTTPQQKYDLHYAYLNPEHPNLVVVYAYVPGFDGAYGLVECE
jgi:hypothetical protein